MRFDYCYHLSRVIGIGIGIQLPFQILNMILAIWIASQAHFNAVEESGTLGQNDKHILFPSTLQDIAIDIKPLSFCTHESADFMQTISAAIYFVACHKFNDRMIHGRLFMAFHFKP